MFSQHHDNLLLLTHHKYPVPKQDMGIFLSMTDGLLQTQWHSSDLSATDFLLHKAEFTV